MSQAILKRGLSRIAANLSRLSDEQIARNAANPELRPSMVETVTAIDAVLRLCPSHGSDEPAAALSNKVVASFTELRDRLKRALDATAGERRV
ncbi:hypothetical protein [Arenimonas sp.]|uniref:hypothetical protein n=1 Tax=Arenimonas sp. TaxID=1872635 RepID=UPI0035AF9659